MTPVKTVQNAQVGAARTHALLAAALVVVTSASPYSYGQEKGRNAQLEEIVVTATRREEGIQSVPTSIHAISGGELANKGITDFENLGKIVSGLDLQQAEGNISSAIYIRGVGTSGSSAAESAVGVVLDGVYQLHAGFAFAEMLDVARVEVLRGPQGTLFGKNTTAGVISIETNDPDTEAFSGRIQGVGGNYDNAEFRGVVNIPLVDDKLAARLSGYTAKRDGYTENVFLDEDTRNVDRHGWRGKLLWNVTDSLEVVFKAEQGRTKNRTDQSLVEYHPSLLAEYGSILPPISIGKSQQQASSVSDEFDRYAVSVEWTLPGHTFTSISGYEDASATINSDYNYTMLSSETGPRAATYLSNTAVYKVTTQEFQLSSDWDGPINYIAGLFWQNDELESTTSLYFGGGDVPMVRPPSVQNVDSTAVFGNISYVFNDQWDASIGVRYTEDEKQGENRFFSGIATFDDTTYSFKLRYTPDDDRMFYAAYDTGFKSGGINRPLSGCDPADPSTACLSADQAFWEPETTENYEIGMKSTWLENRLRVNAALFVQSYENYQVTQSIVGGAASILTNAAEVSSAGLEADVAWLIGDNFTLSGNLTYVRTKYDTYEDAPCVEFGSSRCIDGTQDLSGKQLDNAPKLSFSLSGEYRAPLAELDGVEWFAALHMSYKGDHNLHLYQTHSTEQDAFYLLDTRFGIESVGQWTVTGWIKNLADEEYASWGEVRPGYGLRLTPGMPRTYGVTVDWYF